METKGKKQAYQFDMDEVVRRAIKYVLEGMAVAVAAKLIPRQSLSLKEIAMIGMTAAAVFAILDMYAPAVSTGARTGAGLAIGYTAVGMVPGVMPIPH
jgi:hypothetical protein